MTTDQPKDARSAVSATLWQVSATEDDPSPMSPTTTLRVTHEDDGRLGLLVDCSDGFSGGMLISREDAQQLRAAVTSYLVAAAPQVQL